jgi:hypothetical protein
MARELLLIVRPHMVKDIHDFHLFVSRQSDKLGSPSWLDLQRNSRRENHSGGKMRRKILLKRILLKCQVAKEVGILLDILRYLFNERSALPRVVTKGDSLGEKVSNDVNRWDSTELPVQVTEDLQFAFPKRQRSMPSNA